MNIDILLTGAVVLVAFIYVVRKFMKPGCSGCAQKSCGCGSSDEQCPPLADFRDEKKENEESQV
ncbi:MAG: hypothetical protein ABFS09_13335 [Thermodesulfobacteriota bacterium]